MKKLLSLLVLAALLLSVPASADVDLSGMSFNELVALREQVNLALWATEEWQEVTVPAGTYEIGKDIPAGYWTITPVPGEMANISWGPKLEEGGTRVDYMTNYGDQVIVAEGSPYAEYSTVYSVSWNLTEGSYHVIDMASVIFTPYTGVSLGFK